METHHHNINTLEDAGINQILERGQLGHLGCYANKEIYIVPITYAYSDGYIYSHSQEGKKIEMMRKHPDICIQVEDIQNYFQWKSVITWGRYEELSGDKAAAAMRLIVGKIARDLDERRISDLEVDLKAMFETAIIYRMKIKRATGRFETFD